jgi:Domain of unknown function (DUF4157)
MTEKHISSEEKKNIIHKAKAEAHDQEAHSPGDGKAALTTFQQQVGNRAVQRLLAQRSGDGPFELDDNTADRINRERGGGQSLDSNVQAKMSDSTGQDFSDVKVHTGPESHALNEQISAKAFTTGSDIFFREGAYDPGSSGGQELLAHELTHVAQQRSGSVGGGGGRMTVNAPGDSYEQQADSVAKAVTSSTPSVQREAMPEDEEVQAKALQRAEMPVEDDEVQAKSLQREDLPQEENEQAVQKQEADDEELSE